MNICFLTAEFYAENAHLSEIMDNLDRPYGIAVISYKNLRFGIPLRSHIRHKFCFLTKGEKGLDYTKAVLLCKESYISARPYYINHEEFNSFKRRSRYIVKKFEQYVQSYIKAFNKQDKRVLKRDYKYTTLQNYHTELGL